MIKSSFMRFYRRHRLAQIPLDQWRAASGTLEPEARADLRRRQRLLFWWQFVTGAARFPLTVVRAMTNLVHLLADLERLHGSQRRKMRTGRGCVLDRETWLVNGANIELGDLVKVSAYSALIAGFDAKISIGDYTIIGPGVFVVAANHGIAAKAVPIRYQPWKESPVTIGHDVWIGANAVILPGASIGAGAVIGAGTVVSGTIPAGSIVYEDKGSLVMRQRP